MATTADYYWYCMVVSTEATELSKPFTSREELAVKYEEKLHAINPDEVMLFLRVNPDNMEMTYEFVFPEETRRG